MLVVLDDVAALDLAGAQTPRIDALAASGMSFTRAYSLPTCLATRRALWFGEIDREVMAGMVCSEAPAWPLDQPSLPEAMSAAGYETALFGKWHTFSDELDWRYAPHLWGFGTWQAGLFANYYQCGGLSYTSWPRLDDGVETTESLYILEAIRDAAIAWLQAPHSRPLFTVVSLQSAHGPYEVPPAHLLPAGYVVPANPSDKQEYKAMLAAADKAVGEMLDALSSPTIVFVFGDNGSPMGICPTAQNPNAKGTAGERGNRVPLIVSGPYIAQGVTSNLVSLADVYATIMDGLCVKGLDTGRDGVSFLDTLWDPAAAPSRSYVYTFTHALFWLQGSVREDAIIEKRWKYRVLDDVNESWYDLKNDPNELSPMSELQVELMAPGTAARTRSRLAQVK